MAVDLIYLAVVFFVIAILAYFVGARGLAWFSADLAKTMIWVFLILFVITLIFRVAY